MSYDFPEAEPYRIKVVEPLKITTRPYRLKVLEEAQFNVFNVPAEDVFVDLLTDSGTGAMSQDQWAGMMLGDESYAGARNWYHLQETVREITGFPHVLPTHQGRPAENILCRIHIQPEMFALGNMFFDTTHAHVVSKGGSPQNLVVPQGLDPVSDYAFKGNVDIGQLKRFISQAGVDNVGFLLITVTCNSNGGQPVSMENLRAVREVADEFGLPFYLDAARFAENAFFIKMREGGYKHDSLGSIAREMFSYADGCTMSSKKDGLVNIGGFLALRDEGVYREAQQHLVLLEGFLTYGGLAGRDLEAIARGLREVLQEDYMANRVRQVHLLGNTMAEAGLPVFQPIGGHSVLLDMKQFLSHLPQDEYPAEAFTSHIYLDSGTRTVGLGQLAFGGEDAETGERIYSPLEVVRMAVPRRLYTDNHILLAARSAIRLYEARELIPGMRLKWAPPALRHFTAHLEPTGPISSEI